VTCGPEAIALVTATTPWAVGLSRRKAAAVTELGSRLAEKVAVTVSPSALKARVRAWDPAKPASVGSASAAGSASIAAASGKAIPASTPASGEALSPQAIRPAVSTNAVKEYVERGLRSRTPERYPCRGARGT
jgi:hypothetical protein